MMFFVDLFLWEGELEPGEEDPVPVKTSIVVLPFYVGLNFLGKFIVGLNFLGELPPFLKSLVFYSL